MQDYEKRIKKLEKRNKQLEDALLQIRDGIEFNHSRIEFIINTLNKAITQYEEQGGDFDPNGKTNPVRNNIIVPRG